jgi:hypothetical protein
MMLSFEFLRYIENTKHLCIYKLKSECIPKNILFPKVNSITLINCSRMGISNILKPSFFPNLKLINYLSTHPGDYNIHSRVSNNVKWVFPMNDYVFYNNMLEAGLGRKDYNLITNYIINKNINKTEVDFDIYVPGYNILNGEWYRSQVLKYFLKKEHEYLLENKINILCTKDIYKFSVLQDSFPEYSRYKYYCKEKLEYEFFNYIMDECKLEDNLNLPVSIPYHNSNK